ncbi:hypothetical protein AAGS61_02885 [Lysinibacillus sp. KU-BSD001]|uniref:hypothetical protein n=1 Tax=Lysinibacillus sp. KU-BSD001 TaxID=3141328 RepID=UPI0036E05032
MENTLIKIPVMLLKNKENEGRFLAASIEHQDFNDPNGDVTIDSVANAYVIHRKDHKAPTKEDIDEILKESDAYVAKMIELYGPGALISYNFRNWLDKYELYNHEVDLATFNLISFENEWNNLIGSPIKIEQDDFVLLHPFPDEPTIQNVYVVLEVDENYVEVHGMSGWARIPNTEHNIKFVDSKAVKYEFEDNSSSKYSVQIADELENVALQFSQGWQLHEGLKFIVNDIEFCITFDFPEATLSDFHSGVKIKDLVIPISENHIGLLQKWVLSEPLAVIIDVFENKTGIEQFKEKIANAYESGVKKFGAKPLKHLI